MGTLWSDATHSQVWVLGVHVLYPLVPSVLGTLWAGTLAFPSMARNNLFMGRSRKLEILTLMVNDTHLYFRHNNSKMFACRFDRGNKGVFWLNSSLSLWCKERK